MGQDLTVGYVTDLTFQVLSQCNLGLDLVGQEVLLWELAQRLGDKLVSM